MYVKINHQDLSSTLVELALAKAVSLGKSGGAMPLNLREFPLLVRW